MNIFLQRLVTMLCFAGMVSSGMCFARVRSVDLRDFPISSLREKINANTYSSRQVKKKVMMPGGQNPESPAVAFLPNPNAVNPAKPRPQTIGLNFLADTVTSMPQPFSAPPDTIGAIGPKQFIYALNQGFASFDRQGNKDSVIDTNKELLYGGGLSLSFFADNRIRFDKHSGRWFAVALHLPLVMQHFFCKI